MRQRRIIDADRAGAKEDKSNFQFLKIYNDDDVFPEYFNNNNFA